MSLYRTWRPLTFADLVGQDAVVRTLTAAIESGRLAHAYLFSGPRGSGKTSAAKILARCIDCVNGPTAKPDNTCDNCRAMLAGTALDVLEIDAASNRGIDEIRALREAVKFAPATMRMKVYIIDEAHMLTKEGANAFLKTLEEPPPHAVFILATTEPDKLPVTILSRCQRYAFRRISVPVIIEKLREIAEGEGIAIDDEALAAIAYRADGGLRDALTMLEQIAAFAGGAPATAATLDLAFGATGRQFARRPAGRERARRRHCGVGRRRRGQRCGDRYAGADPLADRRLAEPVGGANRPAAAGARSRPRRRRPRRRTGEHALAGDAGARAADLYRSAGAGALRRQRPARVGDRAAALHSHRRGSDARRALGAPRRVGGRLAGRRSLPAARRPRRRRRLAAPALPRPVARGDAAKSLSRRRLRKRSGGGGGSLAAKSARGLANAFAARSKASAHRCARRFRARRSNRWRATRSF